MSSAFKWKWLCLIVAVYLIGAIGMGWYTYDITDPQKSPKAIEAIKIAFISIGGLSILIPAYLNVANARLTILNIQDQRRQMVLENTFRILERWDDSTLLAARKYTREIKDKENGLSPNDIIKHINEDAELRQSVILLYNHFDLIRVSIEMKRVDIPILKDAISATILDICKRFEPWMNTQSQIHREHVKQLQAHLQE